MFSQTPKPPYYAVIFTSIKSENIEGYREMSQKMDELAEQQEGFLGQDTANSEIGVSVSYWKDLESIKKWKENTDHQMAIKMGRKQWYKCYNVRVAKVEREYGFEKA